MVKIMTNMSLLLKEHKPSTFMLEKFSWSMENALKSINVQRTLVIDIMELNIIFFAIINEYLVDMLLHWVLNNNYHVLK